MPTRDVAARAVAHSAVALEGVGIASQDKVLLAINNDGEGPGLVLTEAALEVAASATSHGPRGRMRLLRAIRELKPTTLVTTPCGAADFLARLHIEFLVDPQELGLRRLVLVGELTPARTYRHLADEFDVELRELWCDPTTGAALAHRDPDKETSFTTVEPGAITLAPLGSFMEWTVDGTPSGWVAPTDAGELAAPTNTVGDDVLVRGRWVSLRTIDQALRRIDGITGWTLEVARPGTLDQATLHVVLGRPTLLDNPMWAGRITDAIRGITPIHIGIEFHGDDHATPARVVDHRGHHLGEVRATL